MTTEAIPAATSSLVGCRPAEVPDPCRWCHAPAEVEVDGEALCFPCLDDVAVLAAETAP